MAQVWVTHDELATLCGCAAGTARAHAKRWRWAERVSSDGAILVHLPDDLAFEFMAQSTLHGLTDHVADRNLSELSIVAAKTLRERAA